MFDVHEAKQVVDNLVKSFELEGFTLSEADKKRLQRVLLDDVDVDEAVDKYVRRVQAVNK